MINNTLYKKSVWILSFVLGPFLVNAQQLTTLIEKALLDNPGIQKIEFQYQIISEKENEVKTLPNTEIGIGYFVSEPETRTGAQRFKVSAKQLFPWFGTITARENYAHSLSDAKYEDMVIAKRKIISSVSKSYYNLYTIKAKQNVIITNISLLKTYEKLALTAVEVGKASAVEVLLLQIRENELKQLQQVLSQQYTAEQTSLNKLLNRDKSVGIDVVGNLEVPREIEPINSTNLTIHPELVKYDKLYASIEQSEILNKKEKRPMLGFGVDYVTVSERPSMNFSDNGKDIAMPFLSLSIPIANTKYKSITKQNKLQQQEITFQKQERLNTLETLLNKAIHERSSSIISYHTQVKNIQKAKHAEEILVKSYETERIDFNDILDVQELQLKLQMEQVEAVKNFYIQTTIINYLSN